MRIEACEIGRGDGRGVREVSAQRKACLDQRLAIFGALISELEQPDSTTLWYSRAAVHGLPRSTGCRSVTLSEPMATGEQVPPRDTLTEEHVQIARATALRALGKPRDAVSVAKNVAKVADSLGWSPLVAEAYLELGLGYQAMQDATAGEDALRRAVWFADASRDDVVRFQATIGLSDTAIDQADYDDAHRMIESARMIARRLPEDGDRNVSLEFQEAALAFWRGDFTGCVERSRAALPVVERSVGRNSVLGARLRLNLWRCLSALGRTSELEEPLKQALAIIDATTGREHPLAADALSGLGSLAREQKRAAEGLALFQEALAIRERIFGPENPECAKLHNNIGNVLVDLGRHDEARRSLERALSIWERAFGADGPAVATASNNLGHLAMKEGDPKAAEAHYRRALEIRRKKRPPGHSETLKTLVYLGRALTAQKNSASLPLLREAMAGYQTAEATPAERDAAKFELGRALYELGDDRVGGREAMEAACAAYDAKNDPFDCRAYLTKLAAKLAR
jgi:tetratricopeptide (TPR) repeat protein